MKDFADRIDFVVEKIGGIGKACSAIGVSYPTIGRWKDGTSDPKMSNLKAFAEVANISLDWLVFGTGESTTSSPTNNTNDEYAYIPAYDIEASAGHGSFTEGTTTPQKHLAFRQHWIKARGLHPKDLAVIFTKGDSMTPTIPEGSAVVIDQSKNQALDGKIYVIRIDDRLYVKRTQWLIGGGLRLISDNQRYQPLDITPNEWQNEQIQICGQVIHASYDLL